MDLSSMTALSIVESTLGTEKETIGMNVDLYTPFRVLPQLLDYDEETLQIDTVQMADYLCLYQRWVAAKVPYDTQINSKGSAAIYESQDPDWQKIIPKDYYHVTYDSFCRLSSALGENYSGSPPDFPPIPGTWET